jgi:hypothetical protein
LREGDGGTTPFVAPFAVVSVPEESSLDISSVVVVVVRGVFKIDIEIFERPASTAAH